MLYKLACSRYRKLGSGSPGVLDELRQVWAASGSDFSWQEVKTLAGSARRFIERKEAADAELYRQAMRWLSRSRI